jgi:hypothetical protein
MAQARSKKRAMLNQLNHWMEYATAVIDVLLLVRVLTLRLQRTYVFLTLACFLAVFFDVAILSLARESPERLRVEVYSNLLVAFVFPLAAWDVFEEIASSMAVVRRNAILRTLTTLLIVIFLGLVLASPAFRADDPTGMAFVLTLTIIVSTGSATGCLAFFWTMRRALRLQKVALPHNTFVWMIFYALSLGGQVVSWLLLLSEETLNQRADAFAPQLTSFGEGVFGIAITVWCAVKLRALPKDVPSASLNEPS